MPWIMQQPSYDHILVVRTTARNNNNNNTKVCIDRSSIWESKLISFPFTTFITVIFECFFLFFFF